MKRTLAVTAIVGILTICGCSTEQPDAPTSGPEVTTGPATTTAPSAPMPSTPTQTSTVSPTGQSGTSSIQAYCETVRGYQQQATEAITQLPDNPQSVESNLAKLQGARDQIREAEATAPASLRTYVADQVEALDVLVAQVRSGDIRSIDPEPYTRAAGEFAAQCDLV